MDVIFDERQLLHRPERYFRRGSFIPHPEQPERAIIIRDMLLANGFTIDTPRDFGEAPIRAVHNADYVSFWKDAHRRLQAESAKDAEYIPTCHPGTRRGRTPRTIHGQIGLYATDTTVPLSEHTWESIYWSAQTAIEAAERIREGRQLVYALSRPPGHHALRDGANGFCIFNNAAIAAHHLSQRFARVALLDIDVHSGNGSLDIFYERGDVFFCSIHIDPADYPTFYLGYEDERGEGEGQGTTLNLIVPFGAEEHQVLTRFDEAITAIQNFNPEALVISLGFDMAADDPLGEAKVTAAGFARMARSIIHMGLPTVLVQEGGYLGPSLAKNAHAFLTAARDERAARND